MTHTEVTLASGRKVVFGEAVADEFRRGELTISLAEDAHAPTIRVFPPGTWRDATVYEEPGGYPLYSHDARVRLAFVGVDRLGHVVEKDAWYTRFAFSEDGVLTVWYEAGNGEEAREEFRDVEHLTAIRT